MSIDLCLIVLWFFFIWLFFYMFIICFCDFVNYSIPFTCNLYCLCHLWLCILYVSQKNLGHFAISHGWPSWLHCFSLLHYLADQHDWKYFFITNLTNESTILNPNILTTHEILESTYFSPLLFCMNFKYQVRWVCCH